MENAINQIRSLPPEWTILLIAAGLLLLILLIVLVAKRRQRTKRVRGGSPGAEADRRDPRLVLARYRTSHPAFYRIMTAFQENHSMDRLLEGEEAKKAFARLSKIPTVPKKKGGGRTAVLSLSESEGSKSPPELEAAMLTLVRSIYMNPEYRNTLPGDSDRELDRFLDNLA